MSCVDIHWCGRGVRATFKASRWPEVLATGIPSQIAGSKDESGEQHLPQNYVHLSKRFMYNKFSSMASPRSTLMEV